MTDLGIFSKKSVSEVFGRIKLHKNNLEIYYFLLRGQFFSTALVIDTFNVKYCSILSQYYKIYLNRDNFLK